LNFIFGNFIFLNILTNYFNAQLTSIFQILVKLNGQELTVLAVASPGSTDDFKQTHVVPDGIDLDQMTSSFSADGVLVIKAPKKK
jgi:hypothetical protein